MMCLCIKLLAGLSGRRAVSLLCTLPHTVCSERDVLVRTSEIRAFHSTLGGVPACRKWVL